MMSESRLRTGGGAFDSQISPLYFIASNPSRLNLAAEVNSHFLIALNELVSQRDMESFQAWLAAGKMVFLDSGVYHLAMSYARQHNLSMNAALGAPPESMEGFEGHFERYVALVRRYESQLWGYIEIDLGGRDHKIKTRQRLEALGLRPIPVYHPLNDGWDYFDHLAQRYDRICFGNIVYADVQTRKRLLSTLWDRRRRYPHLWVHVLGLTPDTLMHAYPASSADSSSWLTSVRWTNSMHERTMGARTGVFPPGFHYRYDSPSAAQSGANKAVRLAAYWAHMIELNWRNHLTAMRACGMEIYR